MTTQATDLRSTPNLPSGPPRSSVANISTRGQVGRKFKPHSHIIHARPVAWPCERERKEKKQKEKKTLNELRVASPQLGGLGMSEGPAPSRTGVQVVVADPCNQTFPPTPFTKATRTRRRGQPCTPSPQPRRVLGSRPPTNITSDKTAGSPARHCTDRQAFPFLSNPPFARPLLFPFPLSILPSLLSTTANYAFNTFPKCLVCVPVGVLVAILFSSRSRLLNQPIFVHLLSERETFTFTPVNSSWTTSTTAARTPNDAEDENSLDT